MLRFISFSFCIPILLQAQSGSVLLKYAQWEKTGADRYFSNQIPAGTSLKKVHENQRSTLYFLCKNGIEIQGQQAAVMIRPAGVLVSWNLDSDAVFENVSQVQAGPGYVWSKAASNGLYFLYHFRDSAGYRFYTPLGAGHAFYEDMKRYSEGDSTVKARVFLPDPLSRKGWIYGGNFRDRNDSNAVWLEGEMQTVILSCMFENDSFRLRTPRLSFADVSPPFSNHAAGRDSLCFSRDQAEFEEVNIFYHITELQNWWNAMGFGDYSDTVVLDAHALFGTDESAFDPTVWPPTIEFGDGGVDDGEDADAPVHEYTHAAFNHLVPGGYNGTERKAVEEGICDFMAVAYSARFTSHQTGWVYNWDGHNEFWPGRNLLNQKTYPGSITSQSHSDGELFGAALLDLAMETGFDSALKIAMEAMPLMVAGMGMRQCARLMLQADSLTNEGRTAWSIIKAFYPRGLLPDAGKMEYLEMKMRIRNSLDFALGKGPLLVYPIRDGVYEIMDAGGRVLEMYRTRSGEILEIKPDAFPPGMYLLRSGSETEKIIRI